MNICEQIRSIILTSFFWILRQCVQQCGCALSRVVVILVRYHVVIGVPRVHNIPLRINVSIKARGS